MLCWAVLRAGLWKYGCGSGLAALPGSSWQRRSFSSSQFELTYWDKPLHGRGSHAVPPQAGAVKSQCVTPRVCVGEAPAANGTHPRDAFPMLSCARGFAESNTNLPLSLARDPTAFLRFTWWATTPTTSSSRPRPSRGRQTSVCGWRCRWTSRASLAMSSR